jgi:beta-galactosidase
MLAARCTSLVSTMLARRSYHRKAQQMRVTQTRQARRKTYLNAGWKFSYGDVENASEPRFDDETWFDVGLPHSFGIPYFQENQFYVGYGWYRRALQLSPADSRDYVGLEFQGVFQDAEIFVNGLSVERHLGGYTAFVVDISKFVTAGSNTVAVRVNNCWNARLAPRAGEHVFNGGIYRDVSLITAGAVRVDWYGTFVTASAVSQDSALIKASTEMVNDTPEVVEVELVSLILFEGEHVTEMRSCCLLPPGQITVVDQCGQVDHPALWHPSHPHLYELRTQVQVAGVTCDQVTTTFGIRSIKFTDDEGFFLNGERYEIHGANVHQDHAGWADAVTHCGISRDVALIRQCGMNFIRGSHYPHHDVFAAECDRQGILFWSELCFWGTGGKMDEGYWFASAYPVLEEDQSEFEASCVRALQEMIRVNRNHPSVIAWSTTNEVFFSQDDVMDRAKKLVKRLVDEVHCLDPSRPAAVGGAQRQGFDELGDLAGYNGDGASLYPNPGRPNFVSEYGSVVSDRPGEYRSHYSEGVDVDYPWRSGKAMWCGFHHGSIIAEMGHMGFVDYYRLPLRAWYWYRKELTGVEPPPPPKLGHARRLEVRADCTTITTDGTQDAQIIVYVTDEAGTRLANEPTVILEVIEGGGIFPTGRRIELSRRQGGLIDGQGAMEFRSYHRGQNRIVASAQGLEPAEVVITAVGGQAWDGRLDRLPAGPPSVMTPQPNPDGTLHNEATSHPVFASSFDPEHLSCHVTDLTTDQFWRAGNGSANQWVMVDLEGTVRAENVVITFSNTGKLPYVVSTSVDAVEFMGAGSHVSGPKDSVISIQLLRREMRFLRIGFPECALDVRSVEIYV